MTASEEKWRPFNCFSVQRAVGSPTGPDRRIGWVIKTLEAQAGQFLLGCKCPVSRGIVGQEQDLLCELPAALFLQNVIQLHQHRWVILRVNSLTLCKIINEENAVLIPKNRGENISNGFLHSELFGAGWAAMLPLHWLLLCLRVIVTQPDFVHGHQSWQEIIWIAPKKFQKLLSRLALLTFLIRVQSFRDPLRGEPPLLNDGLNPLTWDAQLLSY